MTKDLLTLLTASIAKTRDTIFLVEYSLREVPPFDPHKKYNPKEREPYDALSDRFIRSVEMCLKFFRSYEKYLFAENSETLRDLLNKMEKQNIISSTTLWMEMRDLRNRIAHDYLPDEIKKIYDLIMDKYGKELIAIGNRLKTLKINQ